MEEIVDLIVTDSSPSDISDKIKDVLLAKSAERIDAYRPEVASAVFDGEDVVADLIEEKEDSIVFCNPIVAVPAGNGQLGFAPWSPLLKGKGEELEVTKNYVVYIADTQEQIEEQYQEMFSVLKTPTKKLVL